MSDERVLAEARASARRQPCSHCRRVGMLVGHGRLLGYDERSSARVLRGIRLLCSDRHRKTGCGRTSSLWIASVLPKAVVRAATIFAFLSALAVGLPCARAWRQASSMSLRTGYRVAAKLARAGPTIRTTLLARAPPPPGDSASHEAQLLAHLRVVLGPVESFSAYQLAFQRSLFEGLPASLPSHLVANSSRRRAPTQDANARPIAGLVDDSPHPRGES